MNDLIVAFNFMRRAVGKQYTSVPYYADQLYSFVFVIHVTPIHVYTVGW